MNNIKLVAFDLDGTLLHNEGDISEENRLALEKLALAGYEIVIATGRTVEQIPDFIWNTSYIHYGVLSNGTKVYNFKAKENLHQTLLDQAKLDFLLDIVEDGKYVFEVFADGKVYCSSDFRPEVENYFKQEGQDSNWIFDRIHFEADLIDKLRNPAWAVEKMNIHFLSEAKRTEVEQKLLDSGDFYVTRAHNQSIEINHVAANKATGLAALGQSLAISMDDVMAFGDGHNDVEMLSEVGFAIGMGNGLPEIKALADYVTVSNQDHGVAVGLHKFLLRDIKI